MNDVLIYAPLAKVEATEDGGREVSGFATLEKLDKQNQIADYETTVEAFKTWSDEIQAASGGKSKGNIREMHQPKAVGKVIDWFPSEKAEKDDGGNDNLVKGIYVTVRVPPSQTETIEKLDEGILTGFSIGGKYAKKWMDISLGKMRYTPKLSELSLVDNPAVPGATYDVVKGDAIVLGEEILEKKAPEGSFEDLRNRISAACDSKFKGASNYWDGYTVATYPDKVIVYNYGVSKYYEVPYTDVDGEIELGEETEVEQTYVPVSAQKMVEAELQKRAGASTESSTGLTKSDQPQPTAVPSDDGKEVEKTAKSELLKALIEARQSGELTQILEELKKADSSVTETPKTDEPVKEEGKPLVKTDETPKDTTENPLTKTDEPEDLKKYNVAVSKERMAHLEHARKHIQAAMTGEKYGPEEHAATEASAASVTDGAGAETEVVAKLIGSDLQKAAGLSFEEDLQKFNLAKAADLTKVEDSLGEVLNLVKGYDERLKTIESQPALAQPPALNGVNPMFKFSGQPQGQADPEKSREMLEDLAKNDSIPLVVRQQIGNQLAMLDSPFFSHR